jgi:hypothetical protein
MLIHCQNQNNVSESEQKEKEKIEAKHNLSRTPFLSYHFPFLFFSLYKHSLQETKPPKEETKHHLREHHIP